MSYRSPVKTYLIMATVGALGTVVQLLLYHVLRPYFTPFWANQWAAIVAILHNYVWNQKVTFKAFENQLPSDKRWQRFRRFFGFTLLTTSCQSLIVQLMVGITGHGTYVESAVVLATLVIGSVINFHGYRSWVWKT